MDIQELERRIRLPEEAGRVAERMQINAAEYEEQKRLFDEDLNVFIENWKKREDKYEWALKFYLMLACDTHKIYNEKGIAEDIFDRSFYDITIWCEECYRKYRRYGLEEVWWIAQSVKMNLYRLGRLQFEPYSLNKDIKTSAGILKQGTHVLNVHIPAGESLDYEKCLESFRMAETFFKNNQDKNLYLCDSWLLSPRLKEVLEDESNILKFQNMFEIVSVYESYPQAEQRVFLDVKEDKSQYPEDTSLRKRLKRYLLDGKNPGIGIGVIENIYKYI